MASQGLLRVVLLAVAALVVVALVQRFYGPTPQLQAADVPPAWGPSSYADALDILNRDVARERARVAADADAWMPRESLAMVLHARGQLTGSHEDLAEAVAMADTARALAPDGSGPVLARAIVSLAMHRNAVAAEEVARMAHFFTPPDPADQAEAKAIQGDVALYRGDYTAAGALYRAAEQLSPGLGSKVRLADWHRHRGEFAEARRLLTSAVSQSREMTPWTRASVLLQLGGLDLQEGRWRTAEARFAAADAAFPGWWLARAHLAQMAAVRGDYVRAEQLYREAMAGAERPSVMEALASVLEADGKNGEATALRDRARSLWNQRVASHPEAYADHAFEAALQAGNTDHALRLAVLNFRARPYGDARIGLSRAEMAVGHHALAKAGLQELDRSGWRSTEQYVALADACRALGDRACWMHARRAAERLNPHAFDPRAGLLAFGNH